MEQITPHLREIGNFYVVEGEPIQRAISRAAPDASPLDVGWEMREEARKLFGDDFADDTYPDEPIRRVVGRTRPRNQNRINSP